MPYTKLLKPETKCLCYSG